MSTFHFTGDAVIKHLNIRKEGDEDKVLKVDMKIDADCDMGVIEYLDTGLRHFLWSASGAVRNPLVKDIGYMGEVADCTAEIQGLNFSGVRVSKFSIEPKDSLRATVTMTLTFEPNGTDVAILAESVGEAIKADVKAPPSLLHTSKAAGEGMSDLMRESGTTATLSDGSGTTLMTFGEGPDPMIEQAATIVKTNKRASISLVQRHLSIGYNRAARLLEALEAAGVVSAMKPDGSRKVLAS